MEQPVYQKGGKIKEKKGGRCGGVRERERLGGHLRTEIKEDDTSLMEYAAYACMIMIEPCR